MKYLKLKDKKRRELFQRHELQYLTYKAIFTNQRLPIAIRLMAKKKIQKFSVRASITKLVNRCTITGRSRSVYRFVHLSRHMFRKLALDGKLPGIRKSTW